MPMQEMRLMGKVLGKCQELEISSYEYTSDNIITWDGIQLNDSGIAFLDGILCLETLAINVITGEITIDNEYNYKPQEGHPNGDKWKFVAKGNQTERVE